MRGAIIKIRRLNFEINYSAICFVFLINIFIWVAAIYFGIRSVPLLYWDSILLIPFYKSRLAIYAIVISWLVSLLRIAQALYGFDQLYLALYFFLKNYCGFSSNVYLLITIFVIIFSCLVFISRGIFATDGRKFNRVDFILFSTLSILFSYAEKESKINLIGTSYGYIVGQQRFSKMLFADFKVPEFRAELSPGSLGARYALELKTSYVLIVVESMGMPKNLRDQQDLFSSLRSPQINSRYDVIEGVIPSKGATIHGEIRQLCNGYLRSGLFGRDHRECVPRVMRNNGYDT